MKPPWLKLGIMRGGGAVIGGAFQMFDTHGFPLACSIEEAGKAGNTISMPHYFASAIEHGWDDEQAFGHIREALADNLLGHDFEMIKRKCVYMFMAVAERMPSASTMEVGSAMRKFLEYATKSETATA